jgi:hypothetical protein
MPESSKLEQNSPRIIFDKIIFGIFDNYFVTVFLLFVKVEFWTKYNVQNQPSQITTSHARL